MTREQTEVFWVPKARRWNVDPLFKELRHNPMLWLLALVPVALVAARLVPTAHTLLFVLSVLAIVPLAGSLSRATESVAEKTGDYRGRVTQRDAGEPNGTGHCRGGSPCWRVCAGDGLDRRRYCDQHPFHARSVLLFSAVSSTTSRSTTGLPPVSTRLCCSWPQFRWSVLRQSPKPTLYPVAH
jgi:hypothetical protein